MWTRSIVVWLGLLVLAFANGAAREILLVPRVGDQAGRAVSSVSLSAAIVVLAWLTIRWVGPSSIGQAWQVGALWAALTLGFEFLAGHYVFGTPWPQLLADYDVLSGRIWIVVPLTALVAPALAARARG
jgi:hypothetical protein